MLSADILDRSDGQKRQLQQRVLRVVGWSVGLVCVLLYTSVLLVAVTYGPCDVDASALAFLLPKCYYKSSNPVTSSVDVNGAAHSHTVLMNYPANAIATVTPSLDRWVAVLLFALLTFIVCGLAITCLWRASTLAQTPRTNWARDR